MMAEVENADNDPWEAYSLAVLVRDAFSHWGEKAGDVVLPAEVAEAIAISLHRLVVVTRATASAAV